MPVCPGKAASKKLRRLKKSWDEHMNCPLIDITSPLSFDTTSHHDCLDDSDTTDPSTTTTSTTTTQSLQKNSCQIPRKMERYRESDLIFVSLMGSGGFSNVYKAYHKRHPSKILAVKKLQPSVRVNRKLLPICAADLATETALLANLRHPNIISLKGVRGDAHILDLLKAGTFFLCLEPCQETLEDKLERWRKQSKKINRRRSIAVVTNNYKKMMMNTNMGIIQRLDDVAMGIVKGMEYLHTNNIIYRDLKPGNIGFDEHTQQVKLFDFGLARIGICNHDHNNKTVTTNTTTTTSIPSSSTDDNNNKKNKGDQGLMTRLIGTPRYMAPEIARGESNYGFAVDVYSFSILLWQLVTDRVAFENVQNPTELKEKVGMHNLRPSFKSIPKLLLLSSKQQQQQKPKQQQEVTLWTDIDDTYTTVVEDTTILQELIGCAWCDNPKNRPTFSKIRQDLEFIVNSNPITKNNKGDALPSSPINLKQTVLVSSSKTERRPSFGGFFSTMKPAAAMTVLQRNVSAPEPSGGTVTNNDSNNNNNIDNTNKRNRQFSIRGGRRHSEPRT